jgi:hypothetical protein
MSYIVHGGKRLQRHQDDRHVDLTADHSERRRRRISGHVYQQNVHVRPFDFGQRRPRTLGIVDEPKAFDLDSARSETLSQHSDFAMHFVEQSRELCPVGVMADSDQSNACR